MGFAVEEEWDLSPFVSEAQVEEWRCNDANDSLNGASYEQRRKWLLDKAATRGFFDWLQYPERLGVPVAGRVLEIGAGTFWLSSLLSGVPAVRAVTGVELSSARIDAFADVSLDVFGGDRSKIRYVVGDMHRVEEPDGTFDLVVCDATLHHADNLVAVLRECRRVLKPGGWMVATREHMIARYMRTPTFTAGYPEGGSAQYYYRDGWRSAWVNGRFEAVRIVPFYEQRTVRGVRLSRGLQRAARPLVAPVWRWAFPKVAMAARRPG